MTPAPGVTVRGLLNSRPDALGLSIELLAGAAGLDRRITNPHSQKTGLALAGFQEYLRPGRVLIFGESEIRYLESLDAPTRLRTLGLAARFVSGYLYDPSPDSAAAGAMHAWAEVYLPGAGWKGIDPTHGIVCDNAFVPVAHAAVAESVNPIQGSYYSPDPVPSKLGHSILVEQTS